MACCGLLGPQRFTDGMTYAHTRRSATPRRLGGDQMVRICIGLSILLSMWPFTVSCSVVTGDEAQVSALDLAGALVASVVKRPVQPPFWIRFPFLSSSMAAAEPQTFSCFRPFGNSCVSGLQLRRRSWSRRGFSKIASFRGDGAATAIYLGKSNSLTSPCSHCVAVAASPVEVASVRVRAYPRF